MADSTIASVSLPPREAIEYLRGKTNVTTQHWTDVWRTGHARSFMVAGAATDALVGDFRRAVADALEQGTTLRDFRGQFDQIVSRHGWEHNGTPGWRSRIIYETNLSMAYSAGRYAQQTEPDTLAVYPFWQYVHSGAAHPRLEHQRWNGLVLRADDAWWRTHYPPNGWRCGCRIRVLSARGLARQGRSGPDQAPVMETRRWVNPRTGEVHYVPLGIDPGFDYNPGLAWRGEARIPGDAVVRRPPGNWPPPPPDGAAPPPAPTPGAPRPPAPAGLLPTPAGPPAPRSTPRVIEIGPDGQPRDVPPPRPVAPASPAPEPPEGLDPIRITPLPDAPARARLPAEPLVPPGRPVVPANDYLDWAEQLIASRRPDGSVRVVGQLSDQVMAWLAERDAVPSSPALGITSAQLLHLVRDAKAAAGRALSLDDVRRLPQILQRPRAVLRERTSGALLVVFDAADQVGGRVGKLVVQIGLDTLVQDRGRRVRVRLNAIKSGGLVDAVQLRAGRVYEVIEGSV